MNGYEAGRLRKEHLDAVRHCLEGKVDYWHARFLETDRSYDKGRNCVTDLRKGRWVPFDVVQVYYDTLSKRAEWKAIVGEQTLKDIAEFSFIQPTAKRSWGDTSPYYDTWGVYLQRIQTYEQFQSDSCTASVADARDAATLVMDCAGRLTHGDRNNQLTQAKAIEIAEGVMHRSLGELEAWLKTLIEFDPRTVMYSSIVRNKLRKSERCGVTVVVPLSEDAAARMMRGELDEKDLRPSDLQRDARHVFVQAVAIKPNLHPREIIRLGAVQMNALPSQMAFLLGNLRTTDFVLISIAANEENTKIAAAFGFRKCGAVMPVTRKPVLAFQKGGRAYSPQRIAYSLARKVLRYYQWRHRRMRPVM